MAVGPAQPQPYRQGERQPGDRTHQPAGPVGWPGVAGEGAQGAAPHAAQRGPHRGQDHDGGGDGKGGRGAWPRDRWGLGPVHGQHVGDTGQRRRQQIADGQPDRGGQDGDGEVLDEQDAGDLAGRDTHGFEGADLTDMSGHPPGDQDDGGADGEHDDEDGQDAEGGCEVLDVRDGLALGLLPGVVDLRVGGGERLGLVGVRQPQIERHTRRCRGPCRAGRRWPG